MTDGIKTGLVSNILERTNKFAAILEKGMLDRSLSWAYLSETEGSFAIEREKPFEDKVRSFVKLLRQAHQKHDLTEDYLVVPAHGIISPAAVGHCSEPGT